MGVNRVYRLAFDLNDGLFRSVRSYQSLQMSYLFLTRTMMNLAIKLSAQVSGAKKGYAER